MAEAEALPIVPIGQEDVAAFRACLDEVCRERRYLAMVRAPSEELVRSFVLTNLEREAPQFIAFDGETVVGWADIRIHPFEGFQHGGILGMGVRRSHRRMGLGRRLLEVVIEAARARGLTRLELEVFASNAPAIALYEDFGFEHEGRKRHARHLDSVDDDIVCMARFL